jgi:hypothetical protein
MIRLQNIRLVTSRLFFGSLLLASTGRLPAQSTDPSQSILTVEKSRLGVKGSNPFFNLTPGYTLYYEHGKDTDTLTVLTGTKRIDGVETRIIEDRETKNGQLVEITRDYYAIDPATNDVYYFGEDVDVYKNGKISSHGGSWLSGVNGAKFGMMMPGTPKPGQKFDQERAPGVGMDRVEIISDNEKVVTPAGTFDHCLHVVESSPLEKGVKDHKWYVAGIGQVRDEKMLLVKYSGM